MARTKKQTRAKEPVKIRFKELADGNRSIYLDIYVDGKRSYEFLKLYLVPEIGKAAKIANQNTLNDANAIKAQRIIDINNGKAGVVNSNKSKILLVDWMQTFKDAKESTGKNWGASISNTIKLLKSYRCDKVTLAQADKSFFVGFFQYLSVCKSATGKTLSPNTQYLYYLCVACAMNVAVRRGIIGLNPINRLQPEEKPHKKEVQRAYLTVDEVKAMANGDCRNENVKRAFMFACFCGLRFGDINGLTWGQLFKDGQQWRANVTMEKTGHPLSLPLSVEAVKWLPERGTATDDANVFVLPSKVNVEKILRAWAEGSGVEKHLTFHVSRHTFATLGLTAGADIYTVSKLLGHTNVKTTQIYAKIVDSKKDEAVSLVSKMFE